MRARWLWFVGCLTIMVVAAHTVHAQTCSTTNPPASLTQTSTLISWSPVAGASLYKLKVHDNLTGVFDSTMCNSVRGPEVCLDISATQSAYPYTFYSGHTYQVSVATVASCGSVGSPKVLNITSSDDLSVSPTALTPINPTYYYVSPTGNDANPGTISLPFQSLGKARDVVRTVNANMTHDIVIYLRSGYYGLNFPLVLTTQDSGTNGHNIYYLNYPGEVPLISGGQQITGWIPEGNLWKANVGTQLRTRELYVNGLRAIRARSTSGLAGATKTSTGYTTTDSSMATWGNIANIEMVDNNDWKQYRCGVQSIVGGVITMQQPCWTSSQEHPGWPMGLPTWIENAFELLDSPGEWYLNQSTGWLYYMPRTGEDMTKAVVVAPVLESLITGNSVHNLVFQGLNFAYATWLGPSSSEGFAHAQADFYFTSQTPFGNSPWGTWTKIPANVNFIFAHNVHFERNNFVHLGGVALGFGSGSQYNVISGNHFTDISASAINLGEVANFKTTDSNLITMNNKITNNYIHAVASEYQGSVGIWLGYTQNSAILHNELLNLPYTGISIGWGWGANDPTVAKSNYIASNNIHHHMQTLFDGGGIYSLSAQPGNIYFGNLVHDQLNQYGALYLDDGSGFITMDNNVLYNNVQNTYVKGTTNTVYNNYLSLAAAPITIVSNSGLQTTYQDIINLPVLPNPCSLAGDINADCHVDAADAKSWLSTAGNLFSLNFGWIALNFGK